MEQILRDTIISGLASDKIQAKIIKEGKDVTLARVMKIAQLDISTRDILTECRKQQRSTMCTMGKDPRKEQVNQDPVVAVVAAVVVAVAAESMLETWENLLERVRKFHYPLTSVGDVEKEDIKKVNPAKLWKQCRNCGTKRHYEKVCMKKSTHLVNVPGTSTDSELDYFNEHGDPVYAHTYMVHVMEINWKKHLIQFPIITDFKKVRNLVDTSKCPTVLLKADTGVGVNLMNSITFDKMIGDRSVLQLTSLRMEAYGNNTEFQVLGNLHAFLRWKGCVYRQLFYITNANASPNLLSGMVVTHWEC